MTISYEIILTIINLTNNRTQTFSKDFSFNLNKNDENLYNNHHLIAEKAQMFSLFKSEIDDYCQSHDLTINNIDIEEFDINSKTDKVDVYFESDEEEYSNQITLEPNICCYVYPKYESIDAPELKGEAYDSNTIIWNWEDDGYSHYIVSDIIDVNNEEDKNKIIAQLGVGVSSFTETNLEQDTRYTRRLISYDVNRTSTPSRPTTVQTAIAPIDKSLDQYKIDKNYDYTSDDSEREIIEENLEAFHSGVGDFNDLKVYKQMDVDFYQQFKAYLQIRGSRTQREKRYDSVGFNYKVCLESIETVEEQKGEVTFDIDVYPIEKISINDYMYSSQPVNINWMLTCDVLLKREDQNTETIDVNTQEPIWTPKLIEVPNILVVEEPEWHLNNGHVIFILDKTTSSYGGPASDGRVYCDNTLQDLLGPGEGFIRKYLVEPICSYIDVMDDIARQCGAQVHYSVIVFNCNADIPYEYQTGNNMKSLLRGDPVGAFDQSNPTCTDWGTALDKATELVDRYSDDESAIYFYSDGGPNEEGGDNHFESGNTNWDGSYINNVGAFLNVGSQGQKTFRIWQDIQNKSANLCGRGNVRYVWSCIYFPQDGDSGSSHTSGKPPQTFGISYVDQCGSLIQKGSDDRNRYVKWITIDDIRNSMDLFTQDFSKQGAQYYIHPRTGQIEANPTHWEPGGYTFNGWVDVTDDRKEIVTVPWNIDEFKWARINIGPFTFQMHEGLTPIIYSVNEKRAIIPPDSIIRDTNFDQNATPRQSAVQLTSTPLDVLIYNAAQQTTMWQNGYNQIVSAKTSDEKKKGFYIIRGLTIKDTYSYADEDTPLSDVDFADGNDRMEDGYVGSINVYTRIEKMNTVAYGDDIYLVPSSGGVPSTAPNAPGGVQYYPSNTPISDPSHYIWLSGYTDAIIYDGNRIESFELNGSQQEPSHNDPRDHQTEILLSPVANYNSFLYNRKNKTIGYTGNSVDIKHVVEIVDIDKDIYVTGNDAPTNLVKEGDWSLFLPAGTTFNQTTDVIRGIAYPVIDWLNDDVIAHNDEHYISPILNYRFNLEDPDAYTSYYEILPDSDPFSPYKNIVFLHVYYARNIYIQDEQKLSGAGSVYIDSFGDDNIATRASSFYKNSTEILGQTYFRDDYIDDYLWFQAKPMSETRPYYDEKPNPGMDSFYGNVNGRYRKNNKSGKQDLRVVTPQFNLPTTIDANNIKIYIVVTEFNPDTALVAYKWEHPSAEKDSITNTNGDYVTFSSDTLTYKDIVYNDLIETITSKTIELFDGKDKVEVFNVTKPETAYEYDKFYVELYTDNSDVVILNYPSEIVFDENNNTEFGATFKGVVNATTQWAPRIHNGYYYLNQHEYYAYSEFNVEADFEEYNEENYKTINGYITIDVDLFRKAGDSEHYDIVKNTRSELIQNEKQFTWIDGKGLTITPVIDGEYFKQYTVRRYTSPVILFNNVLTSAGRLRVDYYFEDGSDFMPLMVRSYDISTGEWSEWVDFENDSVPNCPLSCAYQVSFDMSASTVNTDITLEDYLCCYLDWKNETEPNFLTNCVTITDHLQAGPDEADGIFNSKIIDFGCETTISIDMFCSHFNKEKECALYIATEDRNQDKLLLENINWTRVDNVSTVTTRYFRYRVVIPYGEKVYWIHKNMITQKSEVMLPILTQIQMTGDYVPEDTFDAFQEIQSFSIKTDELPHKIFNSVYDIISGDISLKGFVPSEIQKVTIQSTESNIRVEYNNELDSDFPSLSALNTPIYAIADLEIETSVKNTPYIYANMDPVKSLDVLNITKGTPQQYCPITMEDVNEVSYKEVFDVDPVTLKKTENFVLETEDDTHYIKLSRNDFDIKTLEITLNEEAFNDYRIVNNLIIFNNILNINDKITITYNILNSFYTDIDYDSDTTQLTIYSDYESELAKQNEISDLTPIYNNRIYTECNLRRIYSNGTKQLIRKDYVTGDSNWKYNSDTNELYYNKDSEDFAVIVNNLVSLTSYELVVKAYSTSKDNGVIGLVVGHIKGFDNITHTLSYLISLSDDYLFNGNNTAIVLDYNRDHPEILASKNIEHDNITNWNDLENGIKLYTKKAEGIIQCKISNWNDDDWNDNSLLEVGTTDTLANFNDSVKYGFCVQSQKEVYFSNPEFAGIVDKNITIEEQITSLKHKYKVYFETNKTNNKFVANNLSMNPIYRTDYKGFIYLTDEHNEPYTINIYRNPEYIKAGGYDKIDVAIECLDYQENPIVSKEIDIDCDYGILNFDDDNTRHLTDINGVIHIIYESALMTCVDTITARTVTSEGKVIESSVEIINEE